MMSFTSRAPSSQVTVTRPPVASHRHPTVLPRAIKMRRKQAHWIHIVFPLSVLLGSTVSSPNVEKNCSISF